LAGRAGEGAGRRVLQAILGVGEQQREKQVKRERALDPPGGDAAGRDHLLQQADGQQKQCGRIPSARPQSVT
jgi:hypothetical protein